MPAADTQQRNVFVYDTTTNSRTLVAGLQQERGSWTCRAFFRALAMCFDVARLPAEWVLVSFEDGSVLAALSNDTLPLGEYFVATPDLSPCPVILTTTPFYRRNASPGTTPNVCSPCNKQS